MSDERAELAAWYRRATLAEAELSRVSREAEELRKALRQIKDYVLLEYREGDKEFQIAMLAATALDDTQDVRDELKKPPWTCAWCSETNHHEGVICMACSRYGQPGAGNVWGPERMRHDPERS